MAALLLGLTFTYFLHVRETREDTQSVVMDCRDWHPIEYVSKTDRPEEVAGITLAEREGANDRLQGWKNAWDNDGKGGAPKSGIGSMLENTVNMRLTLGTVVEYLKQTLKKDTIRLLDAPCGDMTWMSVFLKERNDVEYTGYDIIPQNIAMNKANFSAEPWRFLQFDLLKDKISEEFDLILNRHVNIHLSLKDSIQMYKNILQSGSKYLLTTTFPDLPKNDDLHYSKDKVSGRSYHPVNTELYPLHFPRPVCLNVDSREGGRSDQYIGMWRLGDFRRFIAEHGTDNFDAPN